METIKNWSLLILTFMVILLLSLRDCKNISQIQFAKPNKSQTIVKIDTIWAKDTVYQFKRITKVVTDSIPVHDTIISYAFCNYIRTYKDTLNDKNITIYTTDTVLGKELGSGISYKLKIPLVIDNTTTITNNLSIDKEFGLGMMYNMQQRDITPYMKFRFNNIDVLIGRSLFSKATNIGITYSLLKTYK